MRYTVEVTRPGTDHHAQIKAYGKDDARKLAARISSNPDYRAVVRSEVTFAPRWTR